jgi:hypothetical protein
MLEIKPKTTSKKNNRSCKYIEKNYEIKGFEPLKN